MTEEMKKEDMNFVSKLNDKDLIEIYKIALKQEYVLESIKSYIVESDIYNAIKSNKKIKKYLYKNGAKNSAYVFVINKDDVSKKDYRCSFANDYKMRNYLDVLPNNFGLHNENLKLKSIKKGNILINDFEVIGLTKAANDNNFDNTKYYKFMYNKFGEEYLTALKEYNERENKAKLEYEQKKADSILSK